MVGGGGKVAFRRGNETASTFDKMNMFLLSYPLDECASWSSLADPNIELNGDEILFAKAILYRCKLMSSFPRRAKTMASCKVILRISTAQFVLNALCLYYETLHTAVMVPLKLSSLGLELPEAREASPCPFVYCYDGKCWPAGRLRNKGRDMKF